MPRRRLLLHHHQTAYEPETLELPEEVVIPKKNAPSVNGTLRQTALRVPEVTWQCSGIMGVREENPFAGLLDRPRYH